MTIEIPDTNYYKLLEKLEGNWRTLQVAVLIQNSLSGRIAIRLYVDQWPEFNAIVGQALQAKGLVWYANSSDTLQRILSEASLLSENQHGFGSSFEISKEVKSFRMHSREMILAYFPPEQRNKLIDFKCPDGYTVGRLELDHAEYIMKFWGYFKSSADRICHGQQCIKNGLSVAIFEQGTDFSNPVAWVLQFNFQTINHLYTVESHRRKHLAECAIARMCELLLDKHYTPVAMIELYNPAAVNLFRKIGFIIESGICYTQTSFDTCAANIP